MRRRCGECQPSLHWSLLLVRADYIRPRPRARPRRHGELLKLLRLVHFAEYPPHVRLPSLVALRHRQWVARGQSTDSEGGRDTARQRRRRPQWPPGLASFRPPFHASESALCPLIGTARPPGPRSRQHPPSALGEARHDHDCHGHDLERPLAQIVAARTHFTTEWTGHGRPVKSHRSPRDPLHNKTDGKNLRLEIPLYNLPRSCLTRNAKKKFTR